MGWRVADHITIYRDEGWYGAHPNIIRTPGGDLLTLFHRSPATGFSHHSHPLFDVRACRSGDEGQSWGPVELVTAYPFGGVVDFGTHALSSGEIFLHASTVDLLPADPPEVSKHTWMSRPGVGFHVRSADSGTTWSHPVSFPPMPDAVNGHPASHSGVCRSGLLEMPDGRLLLPGKATDHPEGRPPFFGMMQSSTDGGHTWTYAGRIAVDDVAHFSEPAIHMTPSGSILVLFRCHPNQPPGQDVHLVEVHSDDGGETWSPWRSTTMRGCPGHLLGLLDGRILATVGTRWEGQMGCMARVLDPEAGDLDTAPEIVVRADSLEPDCGYPWSLELNDGRVLVVYYYVYEDGTRGIEGSVLEEY